jgi:hypothetical protein
MGRQAANDAQDNFTSANNMTGGYKNAASTSINAVQPYELSQLASPTGYSSDQLAKMLTSSSQSLGGGQASAVGAGVVNAARNRNAAGVAASSDEAARTSGAQLSQNAVGVANSDAQLAQQKQAAAASSLQGMYGTNTQAVLSALGLSNAAIGQKTAADAQSATNWTAPLSAATSLAGGYMSMKGAGGSL